MTSNYKTWCGVLAAMVLAACATVAVSQAPAPPRAPAPPTAPPAVGQSALQGSEPALQNNQATGAQRVTANKPVIGVNHDQVVAQWLTIGYDGEVQMAKLAEAHADHQSVRDFASQMERQHERDEKDLERFAGANALGTIASRMVPGEMHFLTVQKQIADQCLETAKKDMGAKQGIAFDRAYMGSQIAGHYRLIDTLQVLHGYASPELGKLIDDQMQVAQSHLDHAKKVEQSLIGDNTSGK